MSNKPYNVGYGKPPKTHQFKSGQSGNTKGRVKGSKNLMTDLHEELSEKLLITEGGKPRRISKQRALLKALMAKSLKGDSRAANALLRLIPDAEQARQAVNDSKVLSLSDQEILQAFRQQLVEELAHPTKVN